MFAELPFSSGSDVGVGVEVDDVDSATGCVGSVGLRLYVVAVRSGPKERYDAGADSAIKPLSSRKTPRPLSQHWASLSQQKEPSAQAVTRGKTPFSSSALIVNIVAAAYGTRMRSP